MIEPDDIRYLFIDKSTGGWSCSRLGLFAMNVLAIFAVLYLLGAGAYAYAAAIVTGVSATDAGVYFKSTGKE